jgi:hypothetical protein
VTLSHARALELYSYDPGTGVLTRRVSVSPNARAGGVVGSPQSKGYLETSADGHRVLVHRLVWFFVHGEWPRGDIDHIDGDRTNNRVSNLRDVSRRVNLENQRRARSDSQSGLLGASPHQGRWTARLRVDGKQHYLGLFDTPQLAHAAYIAAKRIRHAGCTI